MKCFSDIDFNFIASIIALIVALIALFLSYKAVHYQIISLLNAQLADKAKECNSNLDPIGLSRLPKQNAKVSGIVSSIITAEELVNYQVYLKKSILWRSLDVQSLIDQFYLQLHTTIRVFLQKGHLDKADIENEEQYKILQTQYNRAIEFLSISIFRDKNKYFERLHSYSLKRNKKLHE